MTTTRSATGEYDAVPVRSCIVRVAWSIVLCASAAAVAAPKTKPTDDEFRAQVGKLATARDRVLLSWGTVKLDGSKPYRFAALGVRLGADNMPVHPDDAGAYIIEGQDAYWLLAFSGMEGSAFHVSDGEDATGNASGHPPWLVLDDTSIQHGENHNHGKAYVWFGWHAGKLVVFGDEDVNVRSDPDTRHHDYDCAKRCPRLAGHRVFDYEILRVIGSAATVDALPALPAW